MTQARRAIRFLPALLALLLGVASATTYRELGLDEIVQAAEVGFVGIVSSVEVEVREGEPWTVVEFEVERLLAGSAEDDLIRLAFLGGDPTGGRELQVHLMPSFEEGERVLLLAYDDEYYSPIVGFDQGLWRHADGEYRDERQRRLGLDEEDRLTLDGPLGNPEEVVDALADRLGDGQ